MLVFRRQVRYPFILCNPCTTKLLGLELKTIPANSHTFGVHVVLLKILAYKVGLPPIHLLTHMHLIYLADRFATRFLDYMCVPGHSKYNDLYCHDTFSQSGPLYLYTLFTEY